jgi:hypothetical protein
MGGRRWGETASKFHKRASEPRLSANEVGQLATLTAVRLASPRVSKLTPAIAATRASAAGWSI